MNRTVRFLIVGVLGLSLTGSASATESTPVASPEPEACIAVPDLRDVYSRLWSLLDTCHTITGVMDSLHVAEEGMVYDIDVGGAEDHDTEYRTYFVLRAKDAKGNTASITVGINDPLDSFNDGDDIAVTGTLLGTVDGTTAFGKATTLPFMEARSVDHRTAGTPVVGR